MARKLEGQAIDTDDEESLVHPTSTSVPSEVPKPSERSRQVCVATHTRHGVSCWRLSPCAHLLEEIMSGWDHRDEVKQERWWNLFFLHPHMLLSRPCRGWLVPRKKFETRLQKFFAGDGLELIPEAGTVGACQEKEAPTSRWERSQS